MHQSVHLDLMIPELLKTHPQARTVLNRYGLQGCGGHAGPAESLRFFAATHDVEPQKLITEIRHAVDLPAPAPSPPRATFADAAYKPFFLAGLAVLLLGGALTGSLMLLWMSEEASFFAPGIHRMNAHANAMVYGFAGMFVLGFGYQALPRFRHARLRLPGLALASFFLLLGGAGLRFFGEFFGQAGIYEAQLAGPWFAAAVAGMWMEIAAFVIFAVVLWKTLRVDGRLRVYERFVFTSALWFVTAAVLSLALLVRIQMAQDFATMVGAVATWQESLRIIQIFGAIGLVVFGVMLRLLPAAFGFRDPGEKIFRRMFWVINGGILIAAIAFPFSMAARRELMDLGTAAAARGVYAFGMLAVVIGFAVLSASFAPWRRFGTTDRSVKFIRAAHLWFAVGLVLLVLEPLYIGVVQGTFGHGYHAGTRHVFTVGFMVMMVIAVSAKVVPTLNGVHPQRLKPLWGVFVILNLALVWRVGGEIAGDFDPQLLAGLYWSGAMIGVALLIWAAHLVRMMLMPPVGAPERATEITPDTRVAAVVETWPATMQVFARSGFSVLANPVARRTVARVTSVRQACAMHGVDLHGFVHELQAAAGLSPACACKHEAPAQAAVAHSCSHHHPVDHAACACRGDKHESGLNPDLTVAEAARSHPAAAAVFARRGMDACCGGGASIRDSARHHGQELNEVMRELKQATSMARVSDAGTAITR